MQTYRIGFGVLSDLVWHGMVGSEAYDRTNHACIEYFISNILRCECVCVCTFFCHPAIRNADFNENILVEFLVSRASASSFLERMTLPFLMVGNDLRVSNLVLASHSYYNRRSSNSSGSSQQLLREARFQRNFICSIRKWLSFRQSLN